MKKRTFLIIFNLCLIIASVFAFSLGNINSRSTVLASENIDLLELDEEYTEEDLLEEDEQSQTPSDIELEELIESELMANNSIAIKSGEDIVDANLYHALTITIKNYIKDKYNYTKYPVSTLYNTMFRNITTLEIDDMEIKSLQGLGSIRWLSLERLVITNNKFTTVDKEIFTYMPSLTYLDLSNNEIETIDLSLAYQLQDINLSSNKISFVDIALNEQKNINLNIASNNFASMQNIKLPTKVNKINLNLINNNITDISDEYFEYSKLNMNIGVQGFKSSKKDSSIDTMTDFVVYKFNVPNLKIKLYKEKSEEDEVIRVIGDEDILDNKLNLKLEVGDYYFIYELNDSPMYEEGTSDKGYYETCKFIVRPAVCSAKFEFKGKIYDSFDKKITGKVKVLLFCEDGGEIYYSLNGGEWTKGAEVMCDQGGDYTIKTKVVKDGYESEIDSVFIKSSLNTIIPDGLMFVLILILTLGFFLVLMPLVNRKFFKHN